MRYMTFPCTKCGVKIPVAVETGAEIPRECDNCGGNVSPICVEVV